MEWIAICYANLFQFPAFSFLKCARADCGFAFFQNFSPVLSLGFRELFFNYVMVLKRHFHPKSSKSSGHFPFNPNQHFEVRIQRRGRKFYVTDPFNYIRYNGLKNRSLLAEVVSW